MRIKVTDGKNELGTLSAAPMNPKLLNELTALCNSKEFEAAMKRYKEQAGNKSKRGRGTKKI